MSSGVLEEETKEEEAASNGGENLRVIFARVKAGARAADWARVAAEEEVASGRRVYIEAGRGFMGPG